jgi:excisionase family DNA binding protein
MAELQEDNFQSVAEVAEDLRVSEKHVRRLMKEGRLRYYRIGRVIRIRRCDKEAFVRSCLAQN